MNDTLRLILIAAGFGLFVWIFFRAMFGTSSGYHEPPEPMDASGWTLVVDGSNFAHRGNEVRLQHLQNVLDALGHHFRGARQLVFCDANLRHKFEGEDRQRFEKLFGHRDDMIRETHGRAADDAILEYASNHPRCIVVSNDWFSKGDEVEMRRGVPLLRIERTSTGDEVPHRFVNVFEDPEQPEKRKRLEVSRLVEG